MKNYYICPKCRSQLMAGNKIVISAKAKDQSEGLITLSTELGNYSADYHPATKFEEGDRVIFLCPICHHDLSSTKHKNLAMVIMTGEPGKEYDIYFSQVAGEHSTIKMMGEHVELYGTHSEKYLDFFNMSQMH